MTATTTTTTNPTALATAPAPESLARKRPPCRPPAPAPTRRRSAKRKQKHATIDLAALPDLPLPDLRHRWHDAFGIEPLARLSPEVLVAALTYHAQEQAHGGLARPVARRLEKLAAQLAATGTVAVAHAEPAIRPGTRLVREWNGAVHEVIVRADRYLWQGRSYASLSEIARTITGARWSEPRFFGTAAKGKATARSPDEINGADEADGARKTASKQTRVQPRRCERS